MDEKPGVRLKRELGLEKIKYVGVSYVLKTNPRVYIVYFDTHRTNVPITTTYVRSFSQMDVHYGYEEMETARVIDIEIFGGNIRSSLFVLYDLAGSRLSDERMREGLEYTPAPTGIYWSGRLKELTLPDLADKGNISSFTQTWKKDRQRVNGSPSGNIRLIDCVIDEAEQSVTFQFLTEATELGDKDPSDNISSPYRYYSGPKQETDPDTFKLKTNRSKTYELQIKVLDVLGPKGWLSTFEGEKIGKKEIVDILDVSEVRVFSNSPSFHWQGMNYNLSQLDGSMYPTDIANNTWGPRHGDPSGYFLDKHLASLLFSIKFFENQMAQKLNSKLKKRGLI